MSKTYQKKEIAENYDFSRAMPDESLVLWTEKQPQDKPVYEPVDMFIFSKPL
jgi:hypothetical protein